jgi:hypothetical protein
MLSMMFQVSFFSFSLNLFFQAQYMMRYFRTTLATNLIKFPMVEVLNKAVEQLPLSNSIRGVAVGAIFTTATLPITNYRFCKSVGEEVSFSALYKAYLPTVTRDIIYSVARTQMNTGLFFAFIYF